MATTNKELRSLLAACRELMRCILTVSREEDGPGSWPVRLRTAREHVKSAVLALHLDDRHAGVGPAGSLNRITATMTTRLVQDLLAEVDRTTSPAVARPSPGGDRDGFHGYTWAIPLPDLMGFLQLQQKSGVLRVNTGTEVVSLVFDEGDLIHACSDNSPPGTRLGEILVRQGAVDLPTLELALLRYSAAPGRLGDALEAQGLITREELLRALDRQVEQIFARLFAAPNAYYSFREGHAEASVEVRRNVLQLLLETTRARDENGLKNPAPDAA